MSVARWISGEPDTWARVEAWLDGESPARVLRDGGRRRVVMIPGPESAVGPLAEPPILVKQYRAHAGRTGLGERLKAALGRSPAEREARNLRRLAPSAAPCAQPLAEALLVGGDRLLVLPFLKGTPLDAWLEEGHRGGGERRRVLEAVGRAVAALHEAGVGHGDLHAGNVLIQDGTAFLLDLQHAGSLRERQRLRDLGDLDFSLWGRASLSERTRLRAAALGLARPFDARARETLRAVGRQAERRAFEHGERRTRRALQPGRVNPPLRIPGRAGLRGLRVPDVDDDAIGAALEAHQQAVSADDERVLKNDARSCLTRVELRASADGSAARRDVVVKEILPRGPGRILADRLRGSAARRAFQAGHGLRARGIGATRPLAYVEQRRLGFPVASWLVMEHLDDPDALACCQRDPSSVIEPLLGLLHRLHSRGAHHGDLKATHVFLDGAGQARLIDLEGVRFRRHLDDGDRLEALAQLNASLPDALPASLRRRAFDRYAARHPFAGGSRAALRRLVALSLAREHRWSGADCEIEAEGESLDGIL